MTATYDQLREAIQARTASPAERRVEVEGTWLQLTGGELTELLQPLWAARLDAPPTPLKRGKDWFLPSHDRRRSDLSWVGGESALLTWWNWVGGTPGDACQTHIAMLFPDGVLKTFTVDSCWMAGLSFEVWGTPPDGLLEACVEAITARPARLEG